MDDVLSFLRETGLYLKIKHLVIILKQLTKQLSTKIIDEKIKCLECYVKVNKRNNYSVKLKYRNYSVIITLIQRQINNN